MHLYIGCNGTVAAISPETGQEVWRTNLGDGGILSGAGSSDVCILEENGTIFAGSCGHLYALEAATGNILWHNDLPGMGYNDVTLAMRGQSVQYVSSHSKRKS